MAAGGPDQATDVVDRHAGDKLMGFGHAVYRRRSPLGTAAADRPEAGGPGVAETEAVEAALGTPWRRGSPKGPCAPTSSSTPAWSWSAAGCPPKLFTPTFAVSRVIGWTAHVVEQTQNNAIIRPSARYVGRAPGVARDGTGDPTGEGGSTTAGSSRLGVVREPLLAWYRENGRDLPWRNDHATRTRSSSRR